MRKRLIYGIAFWDNQPYTISTMANDTAPSAPTKDNAVYPVVLGFIVLATIFGGILFLLSNNNEEEAPVVTPTPTEQMPISPSPSPTPLPVVDGNDEGTVDGDTSEPDVVVNVVGRDFEFSPSEIVVTTGDLVRVNFSVEQGIHDFVIDEFDVDTGEITAGQSRTVEFIATEAGTYSFYCSVGNHRALGMEGTLTVE